LDGRFSGVPRGGRWSSGVLMPCLIPSCQDASFHLKATLKEEYHNGDKNGNTGEPSIQQKATR
ncbi:MAG: hypothetical protein ACRDHW_17530, partial [Ktedonobacteraceae bacterium]